MKYLIRLSFLGSAYCGWQMQANGPSVQAEVMKAVRAVFGDVSDFSGCSRTDSGVHANDYCVSFSVKREIPCQKLVAALNANLPSDIAVLSALPVSEAFHARYDVKSKEYRYRVLTSAVRSPFWEGRAWHRPETYDPGALNQAASFLCGTHDFRSFMAAGSKITDCTRTVYDAHFECDGDFLDFYVSADGFLYNMVRIMVGTLLEVPRKYPPEHLQEVLSALDRSRAGATAPACGLYLNRVEY